MGTPVAVLGASGYTGGELLRLVARHPAFELRAAAAASRVGAAVPSVHPNLAGVVDTSFVDLSEATAAGADLVFSCLPHGHIAETGVPDAPVVVDLSQDHRSATGWIYGLTEFVREELPGAVRIANPGCYPTATLLALTPLAAARVIDPPVVVDGISGVSGAGRAAEDRLLFSNVVGAVSAYGTTEHRHLAEMRAGLATFGHLDTPVSFTPHLAPVARGLVVTVRAGLRSSVTDADLLEVLEDAYASAPFVRVAPEWPSTKAVAGTNHAVVTARVDRAAGMVVASCAIDNLGKGAAGQAIQNANIALGIEETAGLEEVALWP